MLHTDEITCLDTRAEDGPALSNVRVLRGGSLSRITATRISDSRKGPMAIFRNRSRESEPPKSGKASYAGCLPGIDSLAKALLPKGFGRKQRGAQPCTPCLKF